MQPLVLRLKALGTWVAIALLSAEGRQMHAGLTNYHRYLVERDAIRQELDEWKATFGHMAQTNGWMPPPSSNQEERSIEDEEEDHLQRFYMTKQHIASCQALNRHANFSTHSPFTLLTVDEFAAYVGKAYRAVNASDAAKGSTRRRLQAWDKSSSTDTTYTSDTPTSASASFSGLKADNTVTKTGADGTSVTPTTTTSSVRPGVASTKVTTSSGLPSSFPSSVGFGSDLSSFWEQQGNGFNFSNMGQRDRFLPDTVKPAGIDSTPSLPVAPLAPVPAPQTTAPFTRAPTAAPTDRNAHATDTRYPSASSRMPTTTGAGYTDASKGSTSHNVDWSASTCMAPIRNQGTCGNCWAFSTTAAVESGQCIKNGKKSLTKYSEQQLTSCDRLNFGCSGGAPVYAMQYVQQNGLCTANDYPYTSTDGRTASCMRCSAVDAGLTGFEKVTGATDLATAVANQPVIVAVASGNAVWKQYTGGVISSCNSYGLDHAVVVVGYTNNEWKIRNSWGDEWGEKGYIRLARTSDSLGTCGMYGDMSYPTF
ncbi:hypothetical protein PsorP6_000907 [Peronosclerospora sorghi]|uniref:Uncharacterized protein n=1 Tax=Peronosclerospora sorghi TaxID=230839 RepID=A0ACC0WQI0_9STRA|nr:hypothetical protein PsorP6_000907 [Peronosclerospora sorghi]